jgi:hypothetical protein
LAAGDHRVYDRVVALARTGEHLPTAEDFANFKADAPVGPILTRVQCLT